MLLEKSEVEIRYIRKNGSNKDEPQLIKDDRILNLRLQLQSDDGE